MNSVTPDPIARRVARLHQAREGAVLPREVPTTKLPLGSIYGIEVKLMVEETTGPLRKLRFRRAVDGTPTWEATTDAGEPVTGTLVLHVSVAEGEVAVAGEVVVDRGP
jgi:hypothetical protein